MEWRIRYNEKQWRVMTVYSQNVKEIMTTTSDGMEENEEDVLIIVGDWNTRTENEGGWINEDLDKENSRKSKNKIMNSEGKRLISEKERGWTILNGSKGEEREWTYIGENGVSVIDYVIGNQEAVEEIEKMKVGDRTESDHMATGNNTIWNKRKKEKEEKRRKKQKGENGRRNERKILKKM